MKTTKIGSTWVIVTGQYKVQDGSLVAEPHTAQAERPEASGRQIEAQR